MFFEIAKPLSSNALTPKMGWRAIPEKESVINGFEGDIIGSGILFDKAFNRDDRIAFFRSCWNSFGI